MKLKDAERWKRYVKDASGDEYGKACVAVAERWADLMESQLEKGVTVDSVAWVLFKSANQDHHLSGFQAGYTVTMLAACWEYGEALRVWWNEFNSNAEANKTPGAVTDPSDMSGKAVHIT